jgi:hypothetical protein
MQLRNGKTMEHVPTEMNISEKTLPQEIRHDAHFLEMVLIQSMLEDTDTWTSIGPRLHTLLNQYIYYDERVPQYRRRPSFAPFLRQIRTKTLLLMTEIGEIAMKEASESLEIRCILESLASRCISVLAKISM